MVNKDYGCYIAILEYKRYKKKVYKYFTGRALNNITSNRLLINGCIASLNILKEPCNIELKMPTVTGINNKKYKGINKDLTVIFNETILDGGHKLTINITRDGQNELIRDIKQMRIPTEERL